MSTIRRAYCPKVGESLRVYVASQSVDLKSLPGRLQRQLGFGKPTTAEEYLRNVLDGSIYGSTSDASANTSRADANLHRLAVFLAAIGVPADHPVIAQIMAADERFVYPPAQPAQTETG